MKYSIYMRIFSLVFLILAGLNWLSIGLNNTNFLQAGLSDKYVRYIYIIMGMAAIFIAFDRTTFLPFLGWTALPGDLLNVSEPSGVTASVFVPNNPDAKKIVYWATNPGATVDDPRTAYKDSDNAGVVSTKDKGDKVELKLRCPKRYKVRKYGKPLPRHVHYRYIFDNNVVGAVYTMTVDCE